MDSQWIRDGEKFPIMEVWQSMGLRSQDPWLSKRQKRMMGKMIDTVQAESCEVGIERSPRAHVGLQTLQQFHLFPDLPAELQRQIFRTAARLPRIISPSRSSNTPLLYVNRMSRSIARDENILIHWSCNLHKHKQKKVSTFCYFHPARDVIYREEFDMDILGMGSIRFRHWYLLPCNALRCTESYYTSNVDMDIFKSEATNLGNALEMRLVSLRPAPQEMTVYAYATTRIMMGLRYLIRPYDILRLTEAFPNLEELMVVTCPEWIETMEDFEIITYPVKKAEDEPSVDPHDEQIMNAMATVTLTLQYIREKKGSLPKLTFIRGKKNVLPADYYERRYGPNGRNAQCSYHGLWI